MTATFTPGLIVSPCTTIRRVRRLPVRGRVLVRVGQTVGAEDVVAEVELPGDVRTIDAAGQLGVAAADVPALLRKRVGDAVGENEVLAETRGVFGRFRRALRTPSAGTIESVSPLTGQVVLRGAPRPLRRTAFARGKVVEITPAAAVTIEIRAALVQGVFGVGGERNGTLTRAVAAPNAVLDAVNIRPEHAGNVLVGGSNVTPAALRAAADVGAAGLVTGGLHDATLRAFLGDDAERATARSGQPLTIIVTEGFGALAMARRTFELLGSHAGRPASIDGTTQIRAGVVRPEVVIPFDDDEAAETAHGTAGALSVGATVRAIRSPYFGRIGRCVGLPSEARRLATEALVRVAEIEFDDGEQAVVPRTNLELVQG
jgi:hypothetical protein